MPDVLVSLFTNKIGKVLSHVVNITVRSVSITWCELCQQFGWQLQTPALLMYAIYPFQKYKCTHYCMWDIDWKRLDMIHSYTFTSGLTKKNTHITTLLWNRKEKEICAQRRKYKWESPLSDFVTLVLFSVYAFQLKVQRCTFELLQRTGLSLVDLYSLY